MEAPVMVTLSASTDKLIKLLNAFQSSSRNSEERTADEFLV